VPLPLKFIEKPFFDASLYHLVLFPATLCHFAYCKENICYYSQQEENFNIDHI